MSKSDKTKKAIVESAIELFKSKGYYNTSVDEIVNNIGMAKGTYYYYFKQKEDVLLNIINSDFERYFEEPIKIVYSDKYNAGDKLQKMIKALFSTLESSLGIENYFHQGIPNQFKTAIDEIRMNSLLPLINKIVEQGKREKRFKVNNVHTIASIMTRGITYHIDSVFSRLSDRDYLESTLSGIEEFINNALQINENNKIRLWGGDI